jgi:hypothetical protein
VISYTAIANENLRAADWTLRDCREYLEELDDKLRAWQRVSRELSLSELSNKMRTAAKNRANDVDTEANRARRLIKRIVLAIESDKPPDQRSEARRQDIPSAPQAEQPDAQNARENLGARCREGPRSVWLQIGQAAGPWTAHFETPEVAAGQSGAHSAGPEPPGAPRRNRERDHCNEARAEGIGLRHKDLVADIGGPPGDPAHQERMDHHPL